MSYERVFGVSGRNALILGDTPIGIATGALFNELGAHADVVRVEFTEASIETTIDDFVARRGSLDTLVYAATRIGTYALPTMTLDQWEALHNANLKGAFLAFRRAIPILAQQGGGSIVAVSTMGSLHPVLKGNGGYGSSKAGLNALVRSAALDHVGDKIRVNAVLPGAVAVGDPPNDMQRLGGPATQPDRLILGMGAAEDVASAILYLASPAARFITGQTLCLDGGFLLS